MTLELNDFDAARLKQITWLAGRRDSFPPGVADVQLSWRGAAATDAYSSGWFAPTSDWSALAEGSVYPLPAQALRKDLSASAQVSLPEPEDEEDLQLLPWLVQTAAGVISEGEKVTLDGPALKHRLQVAGKRRDLDLELSADLILQVETAKRTLRQWKSKGDIELYYTDNIVYTRCPETELELMFTKINPELRDAE